MFSEMTDKMVAAVLNRQEEILLAKKASDAAHAAAKADPRDKARADAAKSARDVLKQKEKGYDKECKDVLNVIEKELDIEKKAK